MTAPRDSPSPRWCRASSVIMRRVAGETVLVPVAARTADPEFKSARLFVLNETGEYLWSLLVTPQSSLELAQNLMREFETGADGAHSDVEIFLARLRDIGAVREVTDDPAE